MSRVIHRLKFLFNSQSALKQICRSHSQAADGRDPAAFFFSGRVQQLMFQLNDRQHEQVFRPRKLGQELQTPQYVFMTDDELAKERVRIQGELRRKLQVPPILAPRQPVERVLEEDPALAGLYDSRLVCVDVSPDIPTRRRLVSVREPSGTLRTASWDERCRVCQVFVPLAGRAVTPPKMFHAANLQAVLDAEQYVLVLDRAALQFEPDDPDYIRVTSATYEHVDGTRQYQKLQNTRHFGALAFYLAWHRKCDNLMLHFIHRGRLDQAADLVRLFRTLRADSAAEEPSPTPERSQDDSESSSESDSDSDSEYEGHVAEVKDYIQSSSVKKAVLELALQKHSQLVTERRRVAREQRRADGTL